MFESHASNMATAIDFACGYLFLLLQGSNICCFKHLLFRLREYKYLLNERNTST